MGLSWLLEVSILLLDFLKMGEGFAPQFCIFLTKYLPTRRKFSDNFRTTQISGCGGNCPLAPCHDVTVAEYERYSILDVITLSSLPSIPPCRIIAAIDCQKLSYFSPHPHPNTNTVLPSPELIARVLWSIVHPLSTVSITGNVS